MVGCFLSFVRLQGGAVLCLQVSGHMLTLPPIAKQRIPVALVSPFDVPLDLYQLADKARADRGLTWKAFLTAGVRLAIESATKKQNGGTDEL